VFWFAKDHFVDVPHPPVASLEQLVSHTEEVTIERSLDAVMDVASKTKLENAIAKTDSLPSVLGTYTLTAGAFGEVVSRRLACLTDGSTLEEEVLQNDRTVAAAKFRYVVWNYTAKVARPISYAVGYFERTALQGDRTHVRWTYGFQLNRHRFLGFLGSLGDFLFRIMFLDRQYADMMRATLSAGKAYAENAPR
jgi:hypothetical protein